MRYINIITLILVACAVVFTTVLLLSPASLGFSEQALEYEKYFDSENVTTVSIMIDEADWNDILENPLAEEFHVADIEINGDFYSGIGIRTKGMTSLSSVAASDSDRYSFKIQADEYVSGQSFSGLSEFVLNGHYQDPTYMKEFLSYELMEETGVAAPLHAYAAVYINGEYWGLYLMVEAVEEDFALRNFGADYGELYKPDTREMNGDETPGETLPHEEGFGTDRQEISVMPENGFVPGGEFGGERPEEFALPENGFPQTGEFGKENPEAGAMPEMEGMGTGGGADFVYTDGEIASYRQIFDNAVFDGVTDADKRQVIAALKSLADGTNIEDTVDVDAVLRYFAANTALVNLDSYAGSTKHNYYLYEEDGKIRILPWDFNLAFGTFQNGDAKSAVNFPVDTPVSDELSLSERPLIGALLEVEAYKAQYHTYLRCIAEEFFGDSFSERIDSLDAVIQEYVKTDPTAFFSYAEYREGIEALKIFGELRAESILGQINGTIPSTHDGQKADSSTLVNADSLHLQNLGTMSGGQRGR